MEDFSIQKHRTLILKLSVFVGLMFIGNLAFAQTVDCSVSANCANAYCSYAANIERGCNCFDNIDNDNDGKIDKADSNCATYYGLSFVGEGSDCSIVPPGLNDPYDLANTPIMTSQNTADTQAKVAVGDVDGDAIPDMVITSKWNRQMRVVATTDNQYDGKDRGEVKADFKTTGSGADIFSTQTDCGSLDFLVYEHEVLIADIDGVTAADGRKKSEIFGVVGNRGNAKAPPKCFYLVAFKYASATLSPLYNAVPIGLDRPGAFGIADMDGDGKAEIYLRDRIYAAETGKLLAQGPTDASITKPWDYDVTSAPVAVNVSGDNKMELVCGTKIFSIPGTGFTNRNPASPATLTLLHDMNTLMPAGSKAFVKVMTDTEEYGVDTHSSCSVADVDEDGSMDVVVTGASGSITGPTTVFYWNVAKSRVTTFSPPDATYPNGWPWGTGRVNIGDPDGDGELEFTFISGNRLWCLNQNMTTGVMTNAWSSFRLINDSRSGVVAVTIYDFDNDNKPEIVYRDSQQLVVIDGKTGNITDAATGSGTNEWFAVCESHTYTESPVIADANGDGSTDICVTCATAKFDINDDIQQQALGQVRLYYSAGNEWLPTRKVWNQPGYFVVNINDDLTLPFPQLDQNLVFGTGNCPNGAVGPQMPLNVFLNQVPNLSANGCPVFPAPDLSFIGDTPNELCETDPTQPGCDSDQNGSYEPTVEVIPPICGDLAIQVRFNIVNDGDLPISGNIPVSFFKANPTLASTTQADKLYSATLTLANLAVDATYQSPFMTFNGTGGSFTLYIVLNNSGATLPIVLTGSSTTECRIDNNMYSVPITPDPFITTVEKVKDNFKCDPAAANNGELRLRIYKGSVSAATEVTDYTPYAFQWYTGTAGSPGPAMAGKTQYNLTGLDAGDYTVRVQNTQKGCFGDYVSGNITNTIISPNVKIDTIRQTKCTPPNGELHATVLDAGGNTGYTFSWVDVGLNPLGITGADALNMSAGNYKVIVSKSGCNKTIDAPPLLGPKIPDATASVLQHVVDCVNPNSGSVTASAVFSGVAQNPANYTFNWFYYDMTTFTRGTILPAAHGVGETRTGLPVGWYEVEITDNTTLCKANQTPEVQITSQTVLPVASISQVAPVTSCDPNQPNGILTASGAAGTFVSPNDFTFEWFRGDNTLAANKIPIAGGPETVSGTKGETLNNAKGGGVIYTVRITTPLNCTDTEKLTLTEDIKVPVLTLSQLTPNSICDATKASNPYNGSIQATVTFGVDGSNNPIPVTLPDAKYKFTWYDGTTTTTLHNPVPANLQNPVLTGLKDGDYAAIVERTDLHCVSVPKTTPVAKTTINPILSATSTGSNNCDPALTPDGTVTVSVTNTGASPGPFTYQWYDGNAVGVNPLGAANNGTTTTVIKVGGPVGAPKTYTVEVLNTSTGCVNNTSQFVADNSVVPVLSSTTLPNSICSPATNFNGSMTASVTNIPALYTIADYTFVWYDGNTTAVQHNPQPVPTTSVTLSKLDVGTYSVIGTNTKTGCVSAIATNQVANTKLIPTLTPTSTGSNNCVNDPANGINPDGTVSVAVTVAAGPFSYQWYVGSGDPIAGGFPVVPNGNNGQSQTATGLGGPVGAPVSYTVRVVDQVTGCNNYTTTAVADNSIIPVLSTTTNPNSICSPATSFNGDMTVSVTNIPVGYVIGDYEFEWYNGNTTAVLHNPQPSPATSLTLPKLDVGTYSVVGTNTKTGCVSAIATNQVANGKIFPTLAPSSTGSNNCINDPANGINPDGTVSVAVTVAAGPFSYQWYVGSGDPIAGGFAVVPNGNNGQAQTATGLGGPVGAPINYTVLVTDQITGCNAYTTAAVADISIVPVLSTTTNPNSICSPSTSFNGDMTVSVTNIPAGYVIGDYEFEWYDGTTTAVLHNPQPALVTTLTLPKLDVGSYAVVGTNTKTGCVSAIATNQVGNGKIFPTLTPSSTGSNNCINDPGNGINPDGTASVAVTVAAGPFNFQWYVGSGNPITGGFPIVPDPQDGKTATAKGLGGPVGAPISYTVLVTDQITGCDNFTTVAVADESVIPVLSTSTNPNSICSPSTSFNGDMTVSVTNIPAGYVIGDYEFEWYDGATSAVLHNPQPALATTLTLGSLDALQYSVIGTNTKTGCVSALATNTVGNGKVMPTLSTTSTGSHNCINDPGNGINPDGTSTVTITVAAGPFNIQWYTGSGDPIAGNFPIVPDAQGGKTLTATGLGGPVGAPVTYAVRVVDQITGCAAFTGSSVADLSQKPTFDLTPTENHVCAIGLPGGPTQFDGFVTVSNVAHPQMGGSTITYKWFDADAVTGAITGANNGSTTTVLSNLGPDKYAATVTIDDLGCESDPLVREVLDDLTNPVITPFTQANVNCVNPNGIARVDQVDAIAVAMTTNYTYAWYNGLTVSGAVIDTDEVRGTTIAGPATSFTVEVMNKTTGCKASEPMTVVDALVTPTLSLAVSKNNTVCDVPTIDPDGKLVATIGNVGGSATITWAGGGAAAAVASITTTTVTGDTYDKLDANNIATPYTAFVTDDATGCFSATDTENIIDDFTFPAITVAVQPQTACAGTPNGMLTATAAGAVTYTWFDGIGTGGLTHAQTAANSGIINQLPASDFTVRVRINATGCEGTETRPVPSLLTYPVITLTNSQVVTTCGATPNGEATANITGLSGMPTFPSVKYDLFYAYTKAGGTYPTTTAAVQAANDAANLTDETTNPPPPAYTGMQPGYLTAFVIDKNTSCQSVVNTVAIVDDTETYTFTIDSKTEAGLCGGGGGGIEVTVERTGTVGPCPSCTYKWYPGSPTNTNINFFDNLPNMGAAIALAPPLVNNEDLGNTPTNTNPPGVGAGTYTLIVIDSDPAHLNCGNYKTEFVPPSSLPTVAHLETDIDDCLTPNGKIDVTVSGGTSTLGYTIKIFDGPDATAPLVTQLAVPANPAVLSTTLTLDKGEYYIEAKDNDAQNINCPFGEIVELEQLVLPPVITVTSTGSNTSCDPNIVADGSVTIKVDNDPTDIQAKVYRVDPVNPAVVGYATPNVVGAAGASGQSETITGMKPVAYTITVVDQNSNCKADVIVNIPNAQAVPDAMTATPTPETMCANGSNGSALVAINGVAAADLDQFDFTWAQNANLSGAVYTSAGSNGLGNLGELLNQAHATAGTPGNFWPMGTAGNGSGNRTYYVQGTKNATAPSGVGCKTGIVQVVIPDEHIKPNMTLSPVFDSFCLATAANGIVGDGQIIIAADADPTTAGQQNAVGGFNYSWTTPNAGLASPQNGQSNNFTIPQLGDGTYTVTATNVENGCTVSNSVDIDPAPYIIEINSTDAVIDQRICNPDGWVRVNSISLNDFSVGSPNTQTVNNAAIDPLYTFEWFNNAALTGGTQLRDGAGGAGALIQARTLSNDVNQDQTVDQAGDFRAMAAGTYYVRATRSNPALIGFGCPSLPFQVVVGDVHKNPLATLAPFSNTSCLPGGPGEGEITITVTDATAAPFNGGTYTYTWDGANPTAIVAAAPGTNDGDGSNADGDEDHPTVLLDGLYKVTIENNTTGCTTLGTTTIIKNATPVFVQSVTTTDQIHCGPTGDGSITVTEVKLSDRTGASQSFTTGTVPSIAQFNFEWKRSGDAFTQTTAGTTLNNVTYDNVAPGFTNPIGAGTYTVVARRVAGSPGAGCPSAPFSVEILDKRVNPTITLTPFSNTSCSTDPLEYEGEIKVKVTDATTYAPPVGGFRFDYNWTVAQTLIGASAANDGDETNDAGADNDYEIGLKEGAYTIEATNSTTLCKSVSSTTILKNTTPVFVQSVTVVDQIMCTPDGSLTVSTVTLNDRTGTTQTFNSGSTPNISDFEFKWTRDDAAGFQITPGTLLNAGNYVAASFGGTPFGFDSYTVTAKRINGGPGLECESTPYKVDILDKRVFPIATLTPYANTSCDPGFFEGAIGVNVTDNTPIAGASTFTYVWKNATNPTAIVTAAFPATNDGDGVGTEPDEDNPQNLEEGTYVITVESNKSRCKADGTTTIFKNSTPVFTQQVTPTDQVLCGNDGALEVEEVRVVDRDGNIQSNLNGDFPLSDFDFEWYRTTTTNLVRTGDGALGNVSGGTILDQPFYNAIAADNYFVVAKRVAGGPGKDCESAPFPVNILDKRIFPVVTMTPFANTSCSSNPADLEGEIRIKVVDNSTAVGVAGFTYTWNVANPTVIAAAAYPAPNDGDSFGGGENDGVAVDNDADHPTVLAEGVYRMTVESNKSRCITNAQTEIFKNSTPVFTQLVTPTDQVLCTADGKLVVNEVRVIDRDGNIQSSLSDFPISDFDFTYSRTTLANTIPGVTGPQLDNTNLATIGADTYFVVATRVNNGPGFGCSSPEYKVDIQNKQILPIVSLTPLANTSCDPLFFEGEIKVTVTDNSVNLPAPFAPPFVYNYNWTASATPAVLNGVVMNGLVPATHDGDSFGGGENDGVAVDNDGDHPRTLMDGAYTLRATNTQTGCFSDGSTTIFKNSTPVFTQLVVATDQVVCTADGTLTVQEVKVIDRDGNTQSNLNGDFALSDFAFSYDRTTIGNTVVDNSHPAQPVVVLNNVNYANIGFDTYYVVATRVNNGPGLNCSSAPYKVDIDDARLFPKVAFSSIANSSCSDLKPNGSVIATASEQDNTTDNYNFTWTLDGGALAPTSVVNNASPTSTVTNALDGAYVVTATNTVTGCPFDASFNLALDQTRSTPNIIEVQTIDPLDCNPTAQAEVTKITLGSQTNSTLFPPQVPPNNEVTGASLLAFNYLWFEGDPSNPANQFPIGGPFVTTPCIGPGCATPTTGLTPGNYYVFVQDPTTDCQSDPKEVVINDDDIVYPVVIINQTQLQISCPITNGTGELSARADGQVSPHPNYSFAWFNNLTGTAPAVGNNSVLSNLIEGEYSVTATNLTTSCSTTEIFIVRNQSAEFLPKLSLSTQPRTNCLVPDGTLLAREVGYDPNSEYPFDPPSFDTELYVGAKANVDVTQPGAPMPSTFSLVWTQTGLDIGPYTVKIIDNNTGCETVEEVTLNDNRVAPVIVIEEENPLINCDPARPNGQLAATADNGLVGGYTFDWYNGATVAGAILQTSNILIGVQLGSFTVRVTNDATGCFADKTGSVTDGRFYPPSPDASVVQHRTHCKVPDGWVTASVDGVILNYSFDWYDGPDDSGAPDFNGVNYTGRDVGPHTVTATDVTTGCTSEPATVEVLDQTIIPTMEFITTASFCEDLPSETRRGTGTIEVHLLPGGILTDSVAWVNLSDGAFVGTGSYITGLYPGFYRADVETVKGCFASDTTEVKTEVLAYNLVTTNGDQKNDKFVIDCISRFPNNNVKVFNRAGVKVFEVDGYNNDDKVFSGLGEIGVYTTGNNLPVGTYFYVIDKGDGSKPRTGYLELVK